MILIVPDIFKVLLSPVLFSFSNDMLGPKPYSLALCTTIWEGSLQRAQHKLHWHWGEAVAADEDVAPVLLGHQPGASAGPGLGALIFGRLPERRLESSAVRDVMPLALPGDIGVAGCTEGVAMEPRYW